MTALHGFRGVEGATVKRAPLCTSATVLVQRPIMKLAYTVTRTHLLPAGNDTVPRGGSMHSTVCRLGLTSHEVPTDPDFVL